MASYCRWSVNVTPEVTQPTDGAHLPFTTLHEDIRKSLGGGGSIVWAEDVADGNWTGGVNTEELAAATTGAEILMQASDLIFIKHSGFQDVEHLSISTDDLHFDSTSDPSGTVTYFKLAANESMVIPRLTAPMYVHSSANTISVQWVELT
tara:strand:+ start:1826 stop:2275 length:450 start_codon:yes stop_codon:yes gene_type:complete